MESRLRMGGTRGRLLGASALLVLGSVLMGLALFEAGVRLVAPCPRYESSLEFPIRGFFEYDARLGWRGRPDARGVFTGPDFYTTVQHDSRGFRTTATQLAEGRRNWLVLGDSYSWGWGVEDDEIVSEVMMRLDPSLNVTNLSAPGYGPDQELLVLEAFLETRDVEELEGVILFLFPQNDLNDVLALRRHSIPKPRFVFVGGELRLSNVPVPRTLASYLEQPRPHEPARAPSLTALSHTWNRIVHRPAVIEEMLERAEGNAVLPLDQEGLANQLIVALTQRMQARAQASGAIFRVVLLSTEAAGTRPSEIGRRLAERGIETSFFAVDGAAGRRLCIDPHLSARGHHQLAEAVLAEIATD